MPEPEPDADLPWELRLRARFGAGEEEPRRALPERFQLLETLGRGGMGEVVRAFDAELGREVAIKSILGGGGSRLRARLVREAQALARISHPNVVAIHELLDHEGAWLLVMDCVRGANLATLLEEGALEAEVAVGIALGLCAGLCALHEQGIVHRDVKPANVMIDPAGQPLLLDLGVAKLVDAQTRLSRSGQALGTPSTMAPEQLTGEPVGAPADVYGLGATLYHALTGELPIQGSNPGDLFIRIATQMPSPPHELNSDLDPFLSAICMRCLAKAPAERYPDTTALALDLRRWQAGARRLPRSRGRRLLFTAFACATLGLGAWGISVRSSRPPPQDQGRGRIDLGREAAALWSRSKPLLVDAEAIEALARSLEALPEPAPSPRLTARVHALSGFLALARGQEGRAQAALERLEDPQATPAGRALAAALQGDARGLSHAIARGVRRPELRAWRIEARLEGELDPRAAREVLTDLDVLAAHEPLSPKRRAQRVLALLALPNLTRAEEALGELAKPGASLRWRVALSRARLELSEAPGEVLGRLEALPASEAHPERRRALARECLTLCAEVEDEAQEPLGPAQFEREAQLLRLTTLLAPLEPLPEPLVQSLLGQVSHSRMRLELALALSDAAPGRGDVQRAVALLSVRVTADQQARLLPTLRRAVSTEPRSEQRLRSKLLLTYALSKVHEPSSAITAEVQALTEGILALPLGSVQRSLALSNRARALAAAGRGREALRDYDRALALHDGVATGYVERGLLRQDLAQPSGALRDLLRYLELERRESASQREAVAAIWELTRAEGWEERALAPLKEITQLYPQRTGWWIRLAWLQLRLGAPSAAQETLTRAPAFRRASLEEAFGPALLRLRAKLEPRALDALVADLERMRAGETDP